MCTLGCLRTQIVKYFFVCEIIDAQVDDLVAYLPASHKITKQVKIFVDKIVRKHPSVRILFLINAIPNKEQVTTALKIV